MKEVNNSYRVGRVLRVLHGAAHGVEYSLYGAAALGVAQFSPDVAMERYAPTLYRAHMVVTHPLAEQFESAGLSHTQAHIAADIGLEALLVSGAVLASRMLRKAHAGACRSVSAENSLTNSLPVAE